MKLVGIVTLAAVLLLSAAAPARACDPYWDWWCDWYDPYWDLPAYDLTWWEEPWYAAEPVAEPAWSDPVVWVAPQSDMPDVSFTAAPVPVQVTVATAPDPAAEAAAHGLHFVNEVFSGHVTTTAGDLTTYTSTTASYEAGTAARLVATVGTGEATGYDDVVLGGRTTLSDGRSVAGQIYENYVWTGVDWAVNAYVFFQDDAELARLAQQAQPSPPATVAPIVEPAPAPALAPFVAPSAPAAPVDEPNVVAVAVPPAAPVVEASPPVPSAPRVRIVRAGLALAPQADPLARIEVLRGRRIPLWVRATVDDVPARVITWELRAGEVTVLGPVVGSGDEPLVASWRVLSPRGADFVLTVRARVEVPGATPVEVDAETRVVVSSPAVVE